MSDRTVRVKMPGVLEHYCPGCKGPHSFDIHERNHHGKVLGWDGDERKPSIAEAVRHLTPKGVCEYVLRAGVLYFMENCWHDLAGKSRHLEVLPT